MMGTVSPEKLCSLLYRREKNKLTMAYWLYLNKLNEGNLTEEEKHIIETSQKEIHLLDSTAADLLEGKTSALNRTLGGTQGILRKSSRKLTVEDSKDKPLIRLPTIVRNSSVESKGSTDRNKFVINRGGSKERMNFVLETPKSQLSHT